MNLESLIILIILNVYLIAQLTGCFIIYKKKYFINPFSLFLIGVILFLTFPPLLDRQNPIDEEYFYQAISLILFGISAFTIGWFTVRIPPSLSIEFNVKSTSFYRVKKTINILIFFFCLGLFLNYISVKETLGIGLLQNIIRLRSSILVESNINLWETFWRFPYSFSFGFINTSAFFLFSFYILGLIKKRIYKILSFLVIAIAALINFGTGTRMQIFTILGSIFILLYFYHNKTKQKIVGGFIIGFLLFISVLIQTIFRDIGLVALTNLDISLNPLYIISYGLNQFPDFQKALKKFPKEHDYLGGETFFAVLVNPIPREFWPEKPVGIGAIMGEIDPISRKGVSISISIFGELYANFGYIGTILGLFIAGFMLKYLFIKFLKHRYNIWWTIIYIYSLPFIVIEVRGGFLEITMRYLIEILCGLIIIAFIKLNLKHYRFKYEL